MQIFLSFLFFSVISVHACNFKPEVKRIISLSGPVTVILEELSLLQHEKVHGISIFNPVSTKNLKAKIYPGGVFLSQATLSDFSSSVVFYDESRELRKALLKRRDINSQELTTRGLTPNEVINRVFYQLNPFISGCEQSIKMVREKALILQQELFKFIKGRPYVIFYLGEFRLGRPPELVMVNDGVPRLLLQNQLIKSYPSSLGYVNWSSKLMQEIPSSAIHVGIKDTGMNGAEKVDFSNSRFTLYYPGALVPGLTQLKAFHLWAKKLAL
jgi:hypothetical protein